MSVADFRVGHHWEFLGCCECWGPLGDEHYYILNPPGGYDRPGLKIHERCAKGNPEILAGMRDRGFDI